MENLSCTQQYALMVLQAKPGKRAYHSTRVGAGLFAAAISELILANAAELDEKGKLHIVGPLPAGREHLASIYGHLAGMKPKKPKDIAQSYVFTFLDKRIDKLAADVNESLAQVGCAVPQENGKRYAPVGVGVQRYLEKLAAQAAGSEAPEGDTLVLGMLLQHSQLLKKLVPAEEAKAVRAWVKREKDNPTQKLLKDIQSQVNAVIGATAVAASAATS